MLAQKGGFSVHVKRWHAVGVWNWNAGDDVCGICRLAFEVRARASSASAGSWRALAGISSHFLTASVCPCLLQRRAPRAKSSPATTRRWCGARAGTPSTCSASPSGLARRAPSQSALSAEAIGSSRLRRTRADGVPPDVHYRQVALTYMEHYGALLLASLSAATMAAR